MAAPDVLIDTAGFLALWDASDEHTAGPFNFKLNYPARSANFSQPIILLAKRQLSCLYVTATPPLPIFSKRLCRAKPCVLNGLIPTDSTLLQSYFIATATNSGPSVIVSASR